LPGKWPLFLRRYDRRVNLESLPAFAEGNAFHVVIESPRGSALKLKYDATLEVMGVSRPLPAGMAFPFDWGFIPSTRGPDGDPLDAIVVWDVPAFPGVVVECRALGVLNIEQNAVNFDRSKRIRNDRIVAMPIYALRERDVRSLDDVPERLRKEWIQFSIATTALEGKEMTPLGWGSAEDAVALIRKLLSSHV
jgi:inorganic pyrophosphatase